MPSKSKSNKGRKQSKNKSRAGRNAIDSVGTSLSFSRQLVCWPERKRLRSAASLVGFIPTSSPAAGVTGFFIVKGNSNNQPFNTASKPDSFSGFITEVNGSDTLVENGRTILQSMYRYQRCMRSRIKVTFVPTANGDQFILSVFAIPADNVPSLPISLTASRSQIGFREAYCYNGNRSDLNSVESECSSNYVLGMTKAQWEALPPDQVSASPGGAEQWYWVVQYFTADGLVCSQNVPMRVEVAHDVEYYGVIQPSG